MIKGMPPEINPDAHKKAQKKQKIYNKAADPEAKGAEKEWLKRTGAQLPNLIRTIKPKPQDVLKILQYLPALTGGSLGQMADASAGSKILNELPRGGWPARNSHRGLVDDDKLLDTMKRATAAFKA